MIDWEVSSNFDKAVYPPGSKGRVWGNLVNTGDSSIWLDDIGIQYSWQNNLWYPYDVNRCLNPKASRYFSIEFEVPSDILGTNTFHVGANARYCIPYQTWKGHDYVETSRWSEPEATWTAEPGYIKIAPYPKYSAFVSRSVSERDSSTIDPIVQSIEDWGFEIHTVGINLFTAPEDVPDYVREWILKSDCLIAVATKRDISAITGLWKTLEWLHGEVGIAFGVDKPILILRDYEVQLGGLPSSIPSWQIPFDIANLQAIKTDLSMKMPAFRSQIGESRKTKFWVNMKNVAIPVVVGFLAGTAIANSRRKSP